MKAVESLTQEGEDQRLGPFSDVSELRLEVFEAELSEAAHFDERLTSDLLDEGTENWIGI